jgi:apolipoprotein N-acyltransferase
VLGLAGGWVVVEWTRSWLLGGFPWLPLSASQWERVSILQVAPYTGAYGISFVLVMMNLGFAAYAHRLFRERATGINKRSQEFFLALFLLLTCVSLHVTEAFNRRGQAVPVGRIAIVQPKIAQEIKWDPQRAPAILEVLRGVTLEAAASRPDLILWPEAVTPLAVRGDETVRTWVEGLVREARAPLVLGSIAIEQPGQPGESWRNGAFLVTPTEGVAPNYYVKRRLVPFGEYVPAGAGQRPRRLRPAGRTHQQRLVRRGRRGGTARGARGAAGRRDAAARAAVRQRRLERLDRRVRGHPRPAHG